MLQDAVIVARSGIPPYTGYIRTWIEFKVSANGASMLVHLPHFEDGRRVPVVGETCNISYHVEPISGQVGDHNAQLATANVIDQMKCK